MRALITGITGFVGGHLAEHLLAQGDSVCGCSRTGRRPDSLRHLMDQVEIQACDLTDPQAASALVRERALDVVYHLAGLANPRQCAADPRLARRQNVEATMNLFEALRHWRQSPRVIYVSSGYVYGAPSPADLPLRHDSPLQPTHPYAATKWEAEQISARYATQCEMAIVRVRPFNHVGPRQPLGYIVADWTWQIAQMEAGRLPPTLRVGNLDSRRDYSDVRDIVRAYRMLAMEPRSFESQCNVFNIASGTSRSGREILHQLRQLSRANWHWEIVPELVRPDEAKEITVDLRPLQSLIHWMPQFDFAATLSDTLDDWRRLV